jgi:hypothetical protein
MSNGYVRIWEPTHPLAKRDGHVLEHRKVVYDAGIEVPPGYHVHHANHDRTDNRLENLLVVRARDHALEHVHGRGEVVNQWGTYPVLYEPHLPCADVGCVEPHYGHGRCKRHYMANYRLAKRNGA